MTSETESTGNKYDDPAFGVGVVISVGTAIMFSGLAVSTLARILAWWGMDTGGAPAWGATMSIVGLAVAAAGLTRLVGPVRQEMMYTMG